MIEKEKKFAQMGVGLDEYAKSEVFPEDSNPKEKIVELAKLIFERNLTDSSGGNISCLSNDKIYISPRYMGEVRRFQIVMDEIVTLNIEAEVLEGDPDMVTRESSLHISVYKKFPGVKAIIHTHSRNAVVLSSLGIEVPPNTEIFKHLLGPESVEICEEVGPATDLLSETINECLKRREHCLNKYGAAVLMPNHGITVAARNLNYAFCILETIEASAYIHIQKMLLKGI